MQYEGEKIEVKVNSDNKNFFPRNIGIFGTVGSGKSNTTQVLIEEAIQAGWAVIAIDVEGEYVRMNESNNMIELNNILSENFNILPKGVEDFHVYIPVSGDSEAENGINFKVPISQLDSSVISDILEFSEPQYRMFDGLTSELSSEPRPSTSQNSNLGALAGDSRRNSQVQYPYTFESLINRLSSNRPSNDYQRSTATTLISKLLKFGRSRMLDCGENRAINYLPINDLLVGGRLSVIDVSETNDRSRNIAIAYILQSLFDKVIETPTGEVMPAINKVRPKVLVVIEEIHTFVSRQSVSKMKAVLDNLQTISRRGRKRWMSLCLVSQQPGHVPDELFELTNTRFIHQIKSANNLAPVKQTTGGVHDALWTNIPALGPGQCLFTSATLRNPIFVNIRPAMSKRLHTS